MPKPFVLSFADSVSSLMETGEIGESGVYVALRAITGLRPAQGPAQTRPLSTVDSTALDQLLSRKCVRTSFVRFMATGQIGQRGRVAQLLVMWE
ncbi:hypothetical protein DPMN_184195 [Dreissena polymorpha]|uniref:Uncharacterized protein n=1 Tax=Dreissena polymorpha TaxID=45954 RepID=A0A9D4DLA8_DREPO|nr:hypothetical protein DPMN_184195 [Dreissena polymorpha]